MWETWVQALGWEDPLEKGKATPSSNSGLENSMDCIVSPWGRKVSDTTEWLSFSTISILTGHEIWLLLTKKKRYRDALVAQLVKKLPASVGDTGDVGLIPWLGSKEMATHCSILARKIPWTEEPGGIQSMGSWRIWHNWVCTYTYDRKINDWGQMNDPSWNTVWHLMLTLCHWISKVLCPSEFHVLSDCWISLSIFFLHSKNGLFPGASP